MKPAHEKYIPFVPPQDGPPRWPDRELEKRHPVLVLGGSAGGQPAEPSLTP